MYPKSVLSLLFPTFLLCIFIFIWKLSEPADWQSEKTASSNCFTPQMPTMGRAKQGWSQGPKIPPGYPIWVAGAQVPGWLSAASRSAYQQGAGIRSRAETEPKTQIWDAGFSNQILTATITSCICFLGWVILWCPPDQVRNTLKPGKALLVPVRVLPGKISMQELTVLGGKTWLPYGWASSMARYLKKQNGTAIWTLSTEASWPLPHMSAVGTGIWTPRPNLEPPCWHSDLTPHGHIFSTPGPEALDWLRCGVSVPGPGQLPQSQELNP